MRDLSEYDLFIFDCDGTVAERDSIIILPGVTQKLTEIRMLGTPYVCASNQGGVACHETGWETSYKYPTMEFVLDRFYRLRSVLCFDEVYLSFAFYSDKSKMWAFPMKSIPDPRSDERCDQLWRKPYPRMLQKAMKDFEADPKRTLMVGDSQDDVGAAINAGCDYCSAETFFGRGG